MLFHDFLEALLRSWGHEPKGTTVWQLLKEVLQNLPFGVKTELVEIAPEQNYTFEVDEQGDYISTTYINAVLELGKEYIVNWDGTKYTCTMFDFHDLYMLSDNNTDNPTLFMICYIPDSGMASMMGGNFSVNSLEKLNSANIAIYGEQDVVQPMNAKFADIIISNEDGVFRCNTTYAELRKMCEIDPLSIVNVKYVEKTNINNQINLTVKQLKNLEIYETQFMFDFGDYNSSTVVLYNSNGTIGTGGPV